MQTIHAKAEAKAAVARYFEFNGRSGSVMLECYDAETLRKWASELDAYLNGQGLCELTELKWGSYDKARQTLESYAGTLDAKTANA